MKHPCSALRRSGTKADQSSSSLDEERGRRNSHDPQLWNRRAHALEIRDSSTRKKVDGRALIGGDSLEKLDDGLRDVEAFLVPFDGVGGPD